MISIYLSLPAIQPGRVETHALRLGCAVLLLLGLLSSWISRRL